MRLPATLERVGGDLCAVAFRLEPRLALAQQLADLGEELLRSGTLPLEGLDPLEPVHDRACFVHATTVAVECGPDRARRVTIMQRP